MTVGCMEGYVVPINEQHPHAFSGRNKVHEKSLPSGSKHSATKQYRGNILSKLNSSNRVSNSQGFMLTCGWNREDLVELSRGECLDRQCFQGRIRHLLHGLEQKLS